MRTKKKILNDLNPVFPDYIRAPYPFLKKKHYKKDEKEEQFKKFKEMLQKNQLNTPSCESMDQMLMYAKFMKDLLSGKQHLRDDENFILVENCSPII